MGEVADQARQRAGPAPDFPGVAAPELPVEQAVETGGEQAQAAHVPARDSGQFAAQRHEPVGFEAQQVFAPLIAASL